MTMSVVMTSTRMGASGSLLVAGVTYTVSDEFGAFLVGSRFATDPDKALTPDPSDGPRFAYDSMQNITGLVDGAGNPLITDVRQLRRAGFVSGQTFGPTAPELVAFRYDTTTGVTVSGAISGAITTEISGIPMLKLVGNATPANNDTTVTVNLAAKPFAHYALIVYLENPADIDSITVLLANAALSKWGSIAVDIDQPSALKRRKSGWFAISITPENTSAAGGWLWASDAIERIRVRTLSMTGKQGIVHIHSVVQANRMMPSWVLGFDDGFSTLLGKAAGIPLGNVTGNFSLKDVMDYYGFKGTVFVSSNPITKGSPNRCTWDDLRTLVAAGWGIGAQSHNDPQDTNNSGARLLGPAGFAPRAVTAVDAAANSMTTVNHYMPTTPNDYSFPVLFIGTDLPAPLLTNVIYWGRLVDADNFKLHLTEVDSLNAANAIDLTTTGTPANFTWRYGTSTNDSSAIQTDYQACIDACVRELGIRPYHLAVNQGAIDEFVSQAAAAVGFKTIRSTGIIRNFNYLPDNATMRPIYWGNVLHAETGSQAAAEAVVDSVCTDGGLGQSYFHRLSVSTMDPLLWLCNYLTTRVAAGHIDVLTMQEWERRFNVK
mgnify:CR=1 FL=1